MIKTILVPIGHDKGAAQRVSLAVELANKYDAHIQALHVLTPAGDMFKSMPVEAYTAEAFNQYEIGNRCNGYTTPNGTEIFEFLFITKSK